MKTLVVVGPEGQIVCELCHLANRPATRMRGLMGWRNLPPGEGVLIRPTFSVHTAFVRFPIDVIFLDSSMTVVDIVSRLKPWRLASSRKAKAVLELAAGECERRGVTAGDKLGWGSI